MLLKDLVNKSRVCFHDRFNNWEDAVRASCEPLIQDGSITTEYVDAVIGCVKKYGPYIRLFLNLLLVLLFVSPILSISAERVGQTWLEAGAFFSEGTYLEADLQKLNDKQTTLEVSAQKKILEQQIRDLLKKRECFLEDLSLETDSSGTIIQIEVTVSEIKTNEKDHMQIGQDELKKYLEEQLSSTCKITVIFKDR